jgi:pimeloyl-ACP methyl ester carboxylesterase
VTRLSPSDRWRPWAWLLALACVATVLGGRLRHDMPAGPVYVAYQDMAAAAAVQSTPLLLVHGSPGDGRVFDALAESLAGHRRLLIPDLPGFGRSTPRLPDYSVRAHARHLLELLAALHLQRVHVLGFSMGGGVALEMTRQDPARVASLALVSAVGVQEMELLGQYHLNHLVHGVQAAAIWALCAVAPGFQACVPAWSYARNFYDSDQRPLRAVLSRLDQPVLIVHGSRDALVPVEAAFEHGRLVPQAELVVFDTGHFMAFEEPALMAPAVRRFLAGADGGAAVRRRGASPHRVRASAMPFDERTVPRARAVSAAVLASVMALVSATLGGWGHVAAGVQVAQGRASVALAVGAVVAATACLHRRRTVAALPHALAALAIGVLAAPPVLDRLPGWGAWARLLAATTVLAPAAWLLAGTATYRRRRLLLSSWRRLTRWEYWPPWAAYLPVAGYICWLMLKHRRPTLFTAANPGIEAGGVIGESKIAILRGLSGSARYVARTALLEGALTFEEKLKRVEGFRQTNQLSLPLVFKPDAGQRGSGVVVARTDRAVAQTLASTSADTVIQEYVTGEEYGVFYCRRPTEPRGRILSITLKRLPAVRGDGVRTLERLILDDERAVCMARFHLEQQRGRLADVPAAGELVSLGDCGSHCRGAEFLDGAGLRSIALESAIERVAAGFPGFYFGRFDLRAPSAAALTGGRDFTILELNGVTSEPTHIYDPAVSLPEAYRALFEQWRLAFEIGAVNAARGARVTPIVELIRMAWRYRRDARQR